MDLTKEELNLLLTFLEYEQNAYGLNEVEQKLQEKLEAEYIAKGGFVKGKTPEPEQPEEPNKSPF